MKTIVYRITSIQRSRDHDQQCNQDLGAELDGEVDRGFLGMFQGLHLFVHSREKADGRPKGINAVGIIDVPSLKLIGHLPVGWFPSKLQVHPTLNKLIVANAKGFGSGPNGGA